MLPLDVVEPPGGCGSCQACCIMLAVPELSKPTRTRCQHLCDEDRDGGRCVIYNDRPKSCRDYMCMYRAGLMENNPDLRPDRLGIIIDFRAKELASPDPGIDIFSVWELWEDAIERPFVKDILDKLGSHCIVVIRRFNGLDRRILGPDNLMKSLFGIF